MDDGRENKANRIPLGDAWSQVVEKKQINITSQLLRPHDVVKNN